MTFFGYVVGVNGVQKSPEYVEAAKTFPRPDSVKKLRSLLGLVHLTRKFIEKCSEISKSLNMWMASSDNIVLVWDEAMEESFEALKKLLTKDLQLWYPYYSEDALPLELTCDASGSGAEACLSQIQEGERKVVGYTSTTFNKADRNYSPIEQKWNRVPTTLKQRVYGHLLTLLLSMLWIHIP